jgi:mRNA interferase ChpB
MIRRKIAQRGDVYWIDPNPIAGREIKDRHRFVVITPNTINALGVAMTGPSPALGCWPAGYCRR